ncbi:MAG: DUF4259 domain-containing protein [Pseudomonadota bacterium]
MGAWGHGPLDNDGACDWLLQYRDTALDALDQVFEGVQEAIKDGYAETSHTQDLGAMAEVVAACHGKGLQTVEPFMMGTNPNTLTEDLTRHKDAVLAQSDLPQRTLDALTACYKDPDASESYELWAEDGVDPKDFAGFKASIISICERLSSIDGVMQPEHAFWTTWTTEVGT